MNNTRKSKTEKKTTSTNDHILKTTNYKTLSHFVKVKIEKLKPDETATKLNLYIFV